MAAGSDSVSAARFLSSEPANPSLLTMGIGLGLYAISSAKTLIHATLTNCINSRCLNPETPCASLTAPGAGSRTRHQILIGGLFPVSHSQEVH